MTGRVFTDSANIYQDQAKILFDYYKKAAEKIVAEEKDLEAKIDSCQKEIELNESNKKKEKILSIVGASSAIPLFLILWLLCGSLIFAVILAIGALGFAGINFYKYNVSKKNIESFSQNIQAYQEAHKDIRRDYKVKKIGVAYIPVATRIPFEQKSFIVDHTGSSQDTNFELSILNQPKEFADAVEDLQKEITEIPFVEGNENAEEIDTSNYSTSIQNIMLHDYAGQIDRDVRNVSYLLSDSQSISVQLPVIEPGSKEKQFLDEYTTTTPEGKPVVNVFSTDGFDTKLEKFQNLSKMKNQIDLQENAETTEYFKKLMTKLASSVQTVSKMKVSSTTKLTNYTNKIFSTVLKASFNQYSPQLEAEEIERIRSATFDYQDEAKDWEPFNLKSSSRVKYDLMSGSWIAEDGSRTAMPFGINQIDEEIFKPIIKNLMEENRLARLDVYNKIKDQKIDYLNQWHRDVEDFYGRNRSDAETLIQHMHDTFAEYSMAYNTYKALKDTQNTMTQGNSSSAITKENDNAAETMTAFQAQAAQCNQKQEEFSDFMDRIKDDIEESATRFGHIEYYEASLRDSESKEVAMSQSVVSELDPRRQRLSQVSSYYANNANLPPAPQTTNELMEDFSIDLEQHVASCLAQLNAQTQGTTSSNPVESSAQTDQPQYADNNSENSESSKSISQESNDDHVNHEGDNTDGTV